MVSRIDYVHTRRDAVVLILVVVGGGLITQSLANNAKVQGKRQLENEWASTSKKDHKGPNTYEFRYDVENAPTNNIQYRMEERHPNGSVVGSYGQVQPDGKIRVVSYVADKDGIKTYVKDGGGTGAVGGADQYVAEGSSLDPVQRVTSQIIQTAVKSQQHKSPLHDKYHRPTPSTAAVAGQRVDTAHAYHQQRTNLDPAAFRPEDSPGYQETNQPFVGDQLKDNLHTSQAEYRVVPPQQQQQSLQLQQQQPPPFVQTASPPLVPAVMPSYGQQGPAPSQQPTHYMLNVPPLPSLGDNSPLPLLPGQQPLPITPDRGPIMIQLQQPQPNNQQINYPYQPTHVHQQQLIGPSQVQQYQQQPVRVQPPTNLQQHQQARLVPNQPQQHQPQQARVVQQHVLPPQYQQLQQQHIQHQQQLLQQQQQKLQQQQQQAQQQQQTQQQQQQQQQKLPYQQSVMQQPYVQQVSIPAHPSQLQVRGNVQQHQAVVPMQYFHQPNPATTVEQYRQQLQLQAAESQILPVFMLPPRNSVFSFEGKRFQFR